jgi:hypothetical protein
MPGVGFEATTPAFERAKTVHALDRAATGIGTVSFCGGENLREGREHTASPRRAAVGRKQFACFVSVWECSVLDSASLCG